MMRLLLALLAACGTGREATCPADQRWVHYGVGPTSRWVCEVKPECTSALRYSKLWVIRGCL